MNTIPFKSYTVHDTTVRVGDKYLNAQGIELEVLCIYTPVYEVKAIVIFTPTDKALLSRCWRGSVLMSTYSHGDVGDALLPRLYLEDVDTLHKVDQPCVVAQAQQTIRERAI